MFVAGDERGHGHLSRATPTARSSFAVQRGGDDVGADARTAARSAGVADGAQRIADARASLERARDRLRRRRSTPSRRSGRDLDGAAGAADVRDRRHADRDHASRSTDPRGIAAAAARRAARATASQPRRARARCAPRRVREPRLTTLVTGNAAALEQRKPVADAQGAIRDGAVAARDAVSGVDLDSEAVDLLRFQQAYQASSRVIQVARETLQTILGDPVMTMQTLDQPVLRSLGDRDERADRRRPTRCRRRSRPARSCSRRRTTAPPISGSQGWRATAPTTAPTPPTSRSPQSVLAAGRHRRSAAIDRAAAARRRTGDPGAQRHADATDAQARSATELDGDRRAARRRSPTPRRARPAAVRRRRRRRRR